MINNKPVYKYSIDAFLSSDCFSQIILAIPKKLFSVIADQLNEDRYKDIIICEGGNTRAQSVYNAFSKITENEKNKIFVHDAARPLISKQTILKLIRFSKQENAVVLAKKINETVKSVKDGKSKFTVDKGSVWYANSITGVLISFFNNAFASIKFLLSIAPLIGIPIWLRFFLPLSWKVVFIPARLTSK